MRLEFAKRLFEIKVWRVFGKYRSLRRFRCMQPEISVGQQPAINGSFSYQCEKILDRNVASVPGGRKPRPPRGVGADRGFYLLNLVPLHSGFDSLSMT